MALVPQNKKVVVSNTSPIISLVECLPDKGTLLCKLFQKVIIPRQVLDELVKQTAFTHESYLQHYGLESVIEIHEIELDTSIAEIEDLDDGEAYAISLAVKLGFLLIIDEKKGRRIARDNAGLAIEYCTDQIISACNQGIINKELAKIYLDMLVNVRIGPKLYASSFEKLNGLPGV